MKYQALYRLREPKCLQNLPGRFKLVSSYPRLGDLCGALFLTQLDSGWKAAKNHKYINKVVNGYKDKDSIIPLL